MVRLSLFIYPAPTMSDFDLNATISRLFVYPIKSCAGVELKESLLIETGLEFDRAWMVVDESGEFMSQRELPRMALIAPQLKQFEMVLRAPGMLALHIALDAVEQACKVRVWDDECAAYDMGNVAAQWFTDFLMQELPPGIQPMKLRLVRFDPDHKRRSSAKWAKDVEALNAFSDGYPILLISEASLEELNSRLAAQGHPSVSMARFRPNVVLSGLHAHDEDRTENIHIHTDEGEVLLRLLKPCTRCSIPDIDPSNALSSPEVGQTMMGYRQDARVDGAITFGMNAAGIQGIDHALRVGQRVRADLSF
jgi:uncharacterized protein YcbX